MHIQIIGAGSIGLLLAVKLQEQFEVTLYVRREDQKHAIETNGICYEKNNLSHYYKNIHVKLIKEYSAGDITFICVKQTALQDVLQTIKQTNEKETYIFLQNGMGHISFLDDLHHPYVGVVEHGAVRLNDYTVRHLGEGSIRIAPFARSEPSITQLLSANFPFEVADEWQALLHHKLIINAVINPLTAIFKQQNGCIYRNEHIRKLAKALNDETASVLGLEAQLMWERVLQVARLTSENTSSMLADLLYGRKTEIESISGYIIKKATMPVPYTTFVYHAILASESGESHV